LDLSKLNAQQREVVMASPGNVLCVASAGSGKTLAVVYKIAYEISERGMAPDSIVAMTFTNKAATEMRERVQARIGRMANEVYLGTIHKWCLLQIRSHWREFKMLSPKIRILDDYADVLYCLPDYEKIKDNKKLQEKISFLANYFGRCVSYNEDIDPNASSDGDALRIYEDMRKFQYENNVWTFDDFIYLVHKHLEDSEYYRKEISSKIRLLIVDEAQDSNRLQQLLAAKLTSVHGNLMAVGDDYQGIYGFRHANVEGFVEQAKEASVYKLEVNYRSLQGIVELGQAVIGYNHGVQIDKVVAAGRTDASEKPTLLLFPNDPGARTGVLVENEIKHVARWVSDKVYSGTEPHEIAILFRSVRGDFSRLLQAELALMRIPYVVRGGANIMNDKHVKAVIAACAVAGNFAIKKDWMHLLKLVPGIGAVGAGKIASGQPDFPLMVSIAPPKVRDDLSKFFEVLKTMVTQHNSTEACLNTFYRWYIDTLDRADQSMAVKIMSMLLAAFEGSASLTEAVQNFQINQQEMAAHKKDKSGRVVIGTIHSSKGLEFENVWIPNVHDESLPWKLAKTKKDLQEECRCFYVAITRAKNELNISCSLDTSQIFNSNLSRFLTRQDVLDRLELRPMGMHLDFRPAEFVLEDRC